MLFSLGVFMVRYRWAVLSLWVLAFLVAGVFAPRLLSELKGGFGRAETESQQALDLLKEELGQEEAVVTVVFSHPSLEASDPEFRNALEDTLAPASELREVVDVITVYNSGNQSLVSTDGHTTHSMLTLAGSLDDGVDVYPKLRGRLHAPEGFELLATGGIAIFSALNEAAEEDLRRSEIVSFPLVLVALGIVFGTLIAAAIPIAMAGIAVTVTMAFVFLLTQAMDVSIFVLNIASFLGIGISIDYTLLVISRFREEMERHDRTGAVGTTMATAGRAILFSGLTTVVGLSGMLLIPFMLFRSLAVGGVTVVLVAVLVALTLVPAILGILGHRVDRLRVLPVGRRRGGVWHDLATWVMRHPIVVAVPVIAFLLVLGSPFLNVRLGAPWASVLPSDSEPRLGWEKLEREFGAGELAPVAVVVQAGEGGVLRPDVVGDLYDWTHTLLDDARVSRIESIVTLDPSISKEQYQRVYQNPGEFRMPELQRALLRLANEDVTLVRVFPREAMFSPETKSLVADLRQAHIAPGLSTLITGATADLEDTIEVMYTYFPWVIVYIIAVTCVILLVLFRSLVLPLKAVIMNAMSIFAAYGALVFVFQEGNLQDLLGFTTSGFVEVSLPIILFSILFGLSMDYEVFLLTRVKEVYDETGDNTRSVALGLERTGRVITSAAMILVLVAAAFTTSDIIIVKALGLGMALAILLDSTLVRALLVPALMRIMGTLNWWAPGFVLRALPRTRAGV